MASLKNLPAKGKPMLLWRLSFAHLPRSPGAILAAKLRFLKEVRGQQPLFPSRYPRGAPRVCPALSPRDPTAGYSSRLPACELQHRPLVAPQQILS